MTQPNQPRALEQDDPSRAPRRPWAFWLGVALCSVAVGGCAKNSVGPAQTGPAAKLVFTVQPSNAAAGAMNTPGVQVTVQDAQGNTVTTANTSITVAIGTNPASGTLAGTKTVAAARGVATFSTLSLNLVGTGYTLTATATGLTGATSSAFNISAGPAAKVVFTVQPSNAAAGAMNTPAVQVTVQDAQGNTVTTATTSITLAIGTNPASGTLSGATTVAALNGVATFSALSLNAAGTGYTLTASATGLTGATSNAFNISVGLTTVTGSVIDGSTGSGIQGAVAHFLRSGVQVAQVTAGTGGLYHTTLTPGTYDVSAEATGYVGVTLYNTVVSGTTTVIEPLTLVPTSPFPGGISGSIVDARTGVGISGATVELRLGMNAVSGAPLATTSSDALGQYQFSSLSANTYTVLVNATGYTTAVRTGIVVGGTAVSGQNVALSSVGSSTELRIVLTWGAQPPDIDSHLTGPTADGGRFHVYFAAPGSLTGTPWAALDIDDVTSYGPETITIVQQLSGVYRYSVHDYSDRFSTSSTALATSGARVDVYRGSSLITSFFPPPQDGTLWTVFELQGEQLTAVNTMTYESNPSTVQVRRVTAGGVGNDAMVIHADVTAHPKP